MRTETKDGRGYQYGYRENEETLVMNNIVWNWIGSIHKLSSLHKWGRK